MKNPLAIVIFLLWLLLGWCYYSNYTNCCKKGNANDPATLSSATAGDTVTKVPDPLLFNYSKENAITNAGWDEKRKSLLSGLAENQLLEITGLYRSDEKNKTKYKDLGQARANEVRKLFPELKDDKISLLSRLVDGVSDKENPFSSCELALRVNTENVKEIKDKVLIYFPFNSTNKISSPGLETYLQEVVARILKTGETVSLTGHTDNIGGEEPNIALGLKRANIIRDFLIAQKLPAAKIQTQSKGESEPLASNDNEDGRAKNRRTELVIIK